MDEENKEKVKYSFVVKDSTQVELTEPLECPSCQGHFRIDATCVEQTEVVSCRCPICGFRANVPEEA